MKQGKPVRKRVFLLLVLTLLALMFWRSDWLGKWMYPIHYRDDIRISSENYGLEPHLVAAIIRVETNYNTGLQSKKGALGIMQMMPDTAEWIVQQGKFSNITPSMLSERADISIEIGAWYLHSLHQQFGGNMIAAIAAYNAGPGAVNRWISDGTWDGRIETVDRLPYGETRHYIQRVVYYYNKYKKLYPEF
ncbi:lytic transglycosylase domain-containing protein [Paenibacillus humicola]|uniref:lytic transglycosylase domain-containing protein n=1 Tax=Paenibacillus humicola TaxID=3110540 RepID=UPI00237A4F7E|nr:lytic transglycosylase domain-containing protein [Paenibacillus humicola]